jgi:hypothetical protein
LRKSTLLYSFFSIFTIIFFNCTGMVFPPINIPDENLEQAIRTTLGKPSGDLYSYDLGQIISLDASNKGISDVSGLEYCTYLASLNLSDNTIDDISVLKNLTNLVSLDVTNNMLPLDSGSEKGLINLNVIDGLIIKEKPCSIEYITGNIYEITITDSSLETIIRNTIGKLSGNLTAYDLLGLTMLNASNSGISNIDEIRYCSELLTCNLDGNSIQNITALASLSKVQYIAVTNNNLKLANDGGVGTNNLSTITSLLTKGVTVESQTGNQTTLITFTDDIFAAAIRTETGITNGGIYPSDVESISTLNLSNKGIFDLKGIEYCTQLTSLNLNNNNLSTIFTISVPN